MYRRRLSLLGLLVVSGACATVMTTQSIEPGTSGDGEGEPAPFEREVRVPYVMPPEPGVETWRMPENGLLSPDFPFLPNEDQMLSRSIGDASDGYLVNAAQIPQPHPHMAVLSVQVRRDLLYTTHEMLDLVEYGAKYVAEAYPNSVLWLGNFSARGGGDIPYSVSHNSGRDADLSFYLVDAEGKTVIPDDLLPLDDEGKYTTSDGTTYHFDVARNWKLVEGLIERGKGNIQYLFISNPLRRMLLEYAKEQGVDRRIIAHAAIVLQQPGGALPHNDHFHIRIYCSERDVRSGCVNTGRRVPGHDPHHASRRDAIRAATHAAGAEDADVRLAGVRRLDLLGTSQAARVFEAALSDEDARVRAAAARGLGSLRTSATALARRLEVEREPQVQVELVAAIAEVGGRTAVEALTAMLQEPSPAMLPSGEEVDLRAIVADSLISLEDPRSVPALIETLRAENLAVVGRVHNALKMLTNHDPGAEVEDVATLWNIWYEKHRRMPRDQWLALGFQSAGYDVQSLDTRYVWEICKAVPEDDHLSYNAQRVLMRLSGRTPPSLTWPKEDASFYWRRWFERRCHRFGCPPIPEELSTLR